MAVELIDKDIFFRSLSADPNIQDVENCSSSSFLSLIEDQQTKEDGTSILEHNLIEKDDNIFNIPYSPEFAELIPKAAIAVSSSMDMGMKRSVKLKRNATRNKTVKAMPSYLRASTGSCHDYCKYGILHTFEKQEKRGPIRGGKAVDRKPSLGTQIDGKLINARTAKRGTEVRVNLSESEGCKLSPGKQKVVNYLKKSSSGDCSLKSSKLKVLATRSSLPTNVSSQEINSGKHSSSIDLDNSSTPKNKKTTYGMPKNIARGSTIERTFSAAPSPSECYARKSEVNEEISPVVSSGLINSSGRSNVLQDSENQRNRKAAGLSSLIDPKKSSESSTGSKRRDDILLKRAGLLRGVTGSANSLLSSTPPYPSSSRSGSVKPVKRMTTSPETKQKVVPIHGPEEGKSRVKVNNVVEAKPNKSKKSSPTSSLSVKSFRRSITSNNVGSNAKPNFTSPEANRLKLRAVVIPKSFNETKKSEVRGTHGGNKPMHTNSELIPRKLTFQRGKVVSLESDDSGPKKLRFRQGKVVSLESDDSGPKKLRFRQGKVLGDRHVKVDLLRSFRRRKVLAGDVFGKPILHETVVLRHQDVQHKKKGPVSLNNVIEETANKLVETRKSKVKALVGAFETVISLQERKVSITTGG